MFSVSTFLFFFFNFGFLDFELFLILNSVFLTHDFFFLFSLLLVASRVEIDTMVDTVLDDLQLRKCEHNWIGSVESFRGISGGERKRVAIGMEL